MKASEAYLLQFLKNSPQFIIPIYQRNYSWTEDQCRQLWSDLLRAGHNENIKSHFIGSIVYVERGLSNVTSKESLLVIDGQQRLTTATLLIAALAEHFKIHNISEILDTFTYKKLRNYYLLNAEEEGERHFKLILSETDKDTLLAILQDGPSPTEKSQRIIANYNLFKGLIEEHKDEILEICKGLVKLVIVDVALNRTFDNPQLIFESMNSTGLELSQADLIRNYILMGLEPNEQTDLYKMYWRPMEKAFGQTAYAQHFDAFMRHYLTTKTGEIPNLRDVYTSFKAYAVSLSLESKALVADINTYATYYCAMALGSEPDPKLKQAFQDLRELKVDVAFPFLLDVYHDFKTGLLSSEETLKIIRLVESYVFRRAICAIPTNSLNKTFAGLSKSINKTNYLESLQATLLLLPSYRRFPTDEEFQRDLKTRDLYNFRSRSYWLRRLENYGRKERVLVEDYTIEHILPQNESLSDEWKSELGSDWKRIQSEYLHTLGNLTLTGYNSEYSDFPFLYKRDTVTDQNDNPIGFSASPLRLNIGLGQTPKWDEEAIKQRANRLATEAIKVWSLPNLPEPILDQYRPKPSKTQPTYTISDHPHLESENIKTIFMTLRKAIFELDACITEEYLKFYIAYKAETNFVDIVPQAKRLLLIINLPFSDVEDPKGICRDITNIGRWGNGNVELGINSLDEIPYAMGIIRQSFESQMGTI